MPPVGLLFGKVDFANLFIGLSGKTYATLQEANAALAATINYGLYLTLSLIFLLWPLRFSCSSRRSTG